MSRTKALFRILKAVFLIAVAAFIAYYLFINWRKIAAMEWRIAWPLACAAAASYGLYLLGNTLAWRFVLSRLGYPLPVATNAACYLASALTRYVPGKVWPIAGRIVLFQGRGVPREATGTGIVLELIASMTAAVLVILFSIPAWRVSHIIAVPPFALVMSVPVAMLCLYPPVFRRPLNYLLKRVGRRPISTSLSYAHTLALVGMYILLWAFLGFAIWLFARSLTPVKLSFYPAITGMFAVAWLIGYLSFLAPAGIGVREGLFTALLAMDLPAEMALVIAVLLRVVTTVTEVLVALMAFKIGFKGSASRDNA